MAEATASNTITEIVSLDDKGEPFLDDISVKVHAVGVRHPLFSALDHYRYSQHFVPWLRKNADRYDAIIVNGLWNYAPFGASRVLTTASTPYFVFTHGMMDPWFKRTYPVKHMAKQAFWIAGEGRLLAGAKSVLFTCEEERRQARGQFWGHSYREAVVGFGASPPPPQTKQLDLAFRSAVPTLKQKPYLLFFSRIHRKKGCDLLIEAFARTLAENPGVDLVMAGPDQTGWRPELEKLANDRGVGDRIHWPGPIYGEGKWGALYGADAFVLSSHQENFGIAVAEALGCGIPVLISNKVNIWREIEEGQGGLVEDDTLEGTTRLLLKWFAASSDRRLALRAGAAAVFESRFDVRRTAPSLISTIETML